MSMKIYSKDLNRLESHRLLLSTLVPRPIAIVYTISDKEVLNAAPFSCETDKLKQQIRNFRPEDVILQM